MTHLLNLCSGFSWDSSGVLTFEGEPLGRGVSDKRSLSAWIYRRFHDKTEVEDTQTRLDWELLSKLKEQTPYRTVDDSGWLWKGRGKEASQVTKNGIDLLVSNSSLAEDLDGSVRISLPAWRPYLSPGFFVLQGPIRLHDQKLARVYFSGSRLIGLGVVKLVTGWELSNKYPWSLKVLGTIASGVRADAVVLYLAKSDLPVFVEALRASVMPTELNPVNSDFTRSIKPGVSWAYDTGTKHSFGEWISALIAEAILKSRNSSIESAVTEVFRSADVNPREPWLCSER